MEHFNIKHIVPLDCPEKLDDCRNCPYYGGVENDMVRCFWDDDKH